MWTFEQKTGKLFLQGQQTATGYSGYGEGKSNPALQQQSMVGPIPCGRYTIGKAYQHPQKGSLVMRLTPDPANQMFGRAGFLIHGDSVKAPGTASNGCIILSREARKRVSESPDKDLLVVSGV